MAIEFALFGLESERGASLLRSGEQKGTVTLVFEVDGTEYSVERNLAKKAGKVQQTDGVLKTPEGSETLSPRDMKERMLKLLGFEEPVDPKAPERDLQVRGLHAAGEDEGDPLHGRGPEAADPQEGVRD